jgi:hypothetical protein
LEWHATDFSEPWKSGLRGAPPRVMLRAFYTVFRMRLLRHLGRLLKEIFSFAWHNKAWWMVPLILILLLIAGLVVFSSGTATYIYTLF